jgi:hypothetical protein
VAADPPEARPLGRDLLTWVAGCAVVYLALFGLGDLVLGAPGRGVLFLAAALLLTRYVVAVTR